MKKAKKVLSVVLVAMMAFALTAATAFAAAPEKGTITVTNTKKGQTYTLYKLFDAQITFKDDGTQRAIAYTLPEGKSLEGNTWFEVDAQEFVVAKEGVEEDWAKDADAIAWAKEFGTKVGDGQTASADDEEVKFENLDFGYYFVDSTLGAFISVTSDNADGEVVDKNELPTITKVITAVSAGTVDSEGKNAIAEMGATVSYKITVGAQPGAENYVVTDTVPDGITVTEADVTVDGATVTVDGQTITVTFNKATLDAITTATDLEITYDGVVNGNAVIGEEGNANSAVLTWGHDNDDNESEAEVTTVYTAQISIKKVEKEATTEPSTVESTSSDTEANGTPLAGAGFVIKMGDKFYKYADGVVSWVDSEDDATEKFSGEDGAVEAFVGLADGTYTLVEKTVPAGFSKMAEQTVTIASDDYTDANLKQSATVENMAGVSLPETGALGTTIFYIIGVLSILGAGVFMVTNKRIAKEEF